MSDVVSPELMLANMVVQVLILIFLVYGAVDFKVNKNAMRHGIVFTIATFANLVSLAVVMLPSLIGQWSSLVQDPFDSSNLLTSVHHILGLIAAILSVIIAVHWIVGVSGKRETRTSLSKCIGRNRSGKMVMRITFALWVASFALGVLIYALS